MVATDIVLLASVNYKFICYSSDVCYISSDVTRALDELELSIQRVKVTTTPDGCVLDLFFIRDNL